MGALGKKVNSHPGWKAKVTEARRIEAEARQVERKKRTATQQIKELDLRLGKGVGAARERARLSK